MTKVGAILIAKVGPYYDPCKWAEVTPINGLIYNKWVSLGLYFTPKKGGVVTYNPTYN